jgi:FkbM family methyltransferase
MKDLWQRIMRSSERTAEVEINGKRYRLVSDDDYLTHIGSEFEPEMVRLFRCLVNKENIVLDVGANIGCTAILLGDLAQIVYAFEPSPTTFNFLQKNTERSGLQNITIHNLGLGSEAGEFSLTYSPDNRSGGFVSNHTKTGGSFVTETIAIQPLDGIFDSLLLPGLDFIKIDVEGYEGNVINGARRTLSSYRPVVVLELNHWCLNAFQRTSIPDFFDLLRSVFPVLYAVDGGNYLDLHDNGDSYTVMYYHILHRHFPNIVAAFEKSQLDSFHRAYQHRFVS